MATKKRTPKETWDAIIRSAEEDEVARALAETPEEVDEGLRKAGLDPVKVRAKGEELAKRLLAERAKNAKNAKNAWRVEAAEGQAAEQARVDSMRGRYASLPRPELLSLLAAAKTDSRFSGRVAVMFRNHPPEESSDDDLREMLEDLDALRGGK